MKLTADQIIEKYIEIRDSIAAIKKTQKAELEPYLTALDTLEAAADLLMKETGQRALSTEAGTAFYVTTKSVTIDPEPVLDDEGEEREAHSVFLDWVWKFNARQFLTRHVAKEAVEIYMDGPGQGHPPPGVKITPVTAVQFRKR
jgi:hypothetical protein